LEAFEGSSSFVRDGEEVKRAKGKRQGRKRNITFLLITHRMATPDLFDTKYSEFARDLQGACPELTSEIEKALALSTKERREQFKVQVLPSCSPGRDAKIAPAFVLPGVAMPSQIWIDLSAKSRKAIQEHLTLLSFTYLIESGTKEESTTNGWNDGFMKKMMDEMKAKMDSMDFAGLSEKFAGLFGGAGAGAGAGGAAGFAGFASGIPEIPERFMKGQIARLAEEIVKELKVEDFGIDAETMKAAGNDPTKALNIIMEVFGKNPAGFQNTVQKLGKKIALKIQSGAIRPQELVAEAEELMKVFSENPKFVELMEAFRQTFGFENKEAAQAAGRDNENRLSIAKSRLRKKLEEKRAKAEARAKGKD